MQSYLIFIATTEGVYQKPGTVLGTLHVLLYSHFPLDETEA